MIIGMRGVLCCAEVLQLGEQLPPHMALLLQGIDTDEAQCQQ
jgi:hypothetical protein